MTKGMHSRSPSDDTAAITDELIGAEDIETPEDIEYELLQVEQDLARKLGLRKFARRELIAIVRRGEHQADPLLARWLELYTTHLYWARQECGDDEPPVPRKIPVDAQERAAEAALGLLCA